MVWGSTRRQNDVPGPTPFVDMGRTLQEALARSWIAVASVAWCGMVPFLLLAFLVVPIVELYLFVAVSSSIGFGAALFWIVAVSVAGAWLVKREGMGAITRANRKVASGELPTDELINGILIVVAGALMLTPGFLTDAVGLLLLLPPSRAVLRRVLRKRFQAGPILIGGRFPGSSFPGGHMGGRGPAGPGPRGSGDLWDAESWEEPPERPELG
jgi:UPF0716 protein FxsA